MNNTEQSIEVSLSWLDTLSVFSGVASLIMGALAIWLSIVFYKMSSQSEKRMEDSANETKANLEKLEKIFDRMYTDTFGMMEETVYSMNQQNQNGHKEETSNQVQKIINEKISEKVDSDSISKEDLNDLVYELLEEYKETEKAIKQDDLEIEILRYLKDNGAAEFNEIANVFESRGYAFENIFKGIERLAKGKLINNKFLIDEGEIRIPKNAILYPLKEE